jgi:anti-sigma regulatory factor (Ser/Thr protein kinase)
MAQRVEKKEAVRPVTIQVTERTQMESASSLAGKLAAAIGFSQTECDEISLAARELASNLIRHAGGGELQFSSLDEPERGGIQMVSEDAGPGIENVEQALTDGYSTAGGLGNGLGAVNRMMDVLEFCRRQRSGLRIVCQRWVRPYGGPLANRRLEFGAATRSYRFLPESGDAIVIRQWENHALAGVIDGLGHGEFAKRAAQAARQYIEQHFDQSLQNLFRGVGRACRATRGVVMALARFELGLQKVSVATVGNVEVRLYGEPKPLRPAIRRGIVGLVNAPEPVVTEHVWTAKSLLAMHSDGVRSGWEENWFSQLDQNPPGIVAKGLLDRHGRVDDDATVVLARNLSA